MYAGLTQRGESLLKRELSCAALTQTPQEEQKLARLGFACKELPGTRLTGAARLLVIEGLVEHLRWSRTATDDSTLS